MVELETALSALADHPPYPPAPVSELAGRARRRTRRRRRLVGLTAVIAMAAAGTGVGLHVADRGAPKVVTVTGPLPAQIVGVDGAAWRGHGRVALVSAGRLVVVDDAGNAHAVNRSGVARSPAWSADGRWVAYLRAPSVSSSINRMWVVRADGADAHPLTGLNEDVEQFAWSPAHGAETIAMETASPLGLPDSAFRLASPTSPTVTTLAHTFDSGGLAWSPSGKDLAVGELLATRGARTTAEIEIIPIHGGAARAVSVEAASRAVPEPAAWWPDGQGLMIWNDTAGSASLAADGLPLISLDLRTGVSHDLGTALQQPLTFYGPSGQVVFAAGTDRSIWNGGKHLRVCDPATGTCTQPRHGAGTMTFEPSGTTSTLVYVSAPAAAVDAETGPPGADLKPGQPPYTSAFVGRWWDSQHLAVLAGGSPPRLETQPGSDLLAGTGTGAHTPTVIPTGLVYIRHDQLWVLDDRTGRAHKIAGPLGDGNVYARSYYGQIDWASTYAWHP